jgi:GT2 family glycosyltransferase
MSASVLVASWNGARRLERLLPSLDGEAQVIVVDNGSTDGTGDLLARRFPHVDVIARPRNEGFSRAVNLAARAAEGDALVLVNDDCVCRPGFVAALAGALDPGDGVAMAAGVLLEARNPGIVDSAGMELDDTLLVFDYLNGRPVAALDELPAPPVGPSGAAAAFDRDAFLELGGFDEALFAYWEDVDLVLRLRAAGASCALVPEARALHDHSATLGSGSRAKNYLTGFGRGYVLRKWGVVSGRRGVAALAREAGICAAQLVVDRTVSGATGRLAGWRAAEPGAYPSAEATLARRGLADELHRRVVRRRRLQRTAS